MATERIHRREELSRARRIVVKVGSSLIASPGEDGGVDTRLMRRLAGQIARLREEGREVVLVSSGAVASGLVALGMETRPEALVLLQATAAVGQVALMEAWRRAFSRCGGGVVGQVLLTRDVLNERRRYLHARATLRALLDLGAVPVVNENDTVAVEELKLRMGDNDALAMNVAQLVDAHAVVLLSDVPGLYDRAPEEAEAALIPHVEELTEEVAAAAGGSGSAVGSGGMATKLSAAAQAAHGGIPLVVADGKRRDVLGEIFRGREVGTFFSPARTKRKSARQQWIAFSRPPAGRVLVDEGASRALVQKKRSLLAIGVRGVEGDFAEAETVSVVDPSGRELARGLANVSAGELRRIAGRRSDAFARILGYDCPATVIHRDNLTMLE